MGYRGSFRDILHTLDQFVGIPLGELGQLVRRPYTGTAVRNRGWAGNVVHDLIGDKKRNEPEADLSEHGIEVKIIPIDRRGRVREPTKIDTLNYDKVARTSWWESGTFHKMRSVLFVPIVKLEDAAPPDYFLRFPFVWFPSRQDLSRLKADYEEVRSLIVDGKFDMISSARPPLGQGVALHPKPNHGRASPNTQAHHNGVAYPVEKRAWMLRATFTQPIMDRNLSEAHRRAKEAHARLLEDSG